MKYNIGHIFPPPPQTRKFGVRDEKINKKKIDKSKRNKIEVEKSKHSCENGGNEIAMARDFHNEVVGAFCKLHFSYRAPKLLWAIDIRARAKFL